jgi:CubicO group peptidase (beta-lactamase class C family)
MKKHSLTLLTLILTFSVKAQIGAFDSLVGAYNAQHSFNGVALLAVNGKVLHSKAIGVASKDTKKPISLESKFRIASMTKVFTAIMVMKLVEDHKLDLNKTIGEYFPAYTGEGREKVTLHHLLTYSSGIENKTESLSMKPFQTKTTLDDFITEYCSGRLIEVPGVKSSYSNTEYIILHKIIELVSGKSYSEYLNEVIIKPLKLKNTGIISSKKELKGLVQAYTYSDSLKTLTADEPYYGEMYFGAGSMYATCNDLLVFDQAIFSNKLLTKQSTQKLLEIHDKLGYTAYGFWGSTGWGSFNEKFYYRTGGILGSTSNWIHTMGTNKTIILLSNTDATNLYELSEKIYLLQ